MVPRAIALDGNRYEGTDSTLDENTLLVLQTRTYFLRRYACQSGPSVEMLVVFCEKNRRNVHPPEVCLQAGGGRIESERRLTLDDVPGHQDFDARELVVSTNGKEQYYFYTYQCDNLYTPDYLRFQIGMIQKGLLHRKVGGTLIRVSTEVGPGGLEESRRVVHTMMRELMPDIERALSSK